ncbi:homoserine O-acetyltransferase [Ruegeria halocynthiae]|uniref:Homoserine O-acetyltransferase n=1 Tax=Ruegeria halocynthiae TaxID=985054 RepID=A0A1H3FM65_9RHOB|nr:alpha/beta fold hydrolase [Ruegeria halocynthiae]SDX92173.1 homoserine O-acetyltransferase [Ruegeria halocynthiae]
MPEFEIFELGDLPLLSGGTLKDAKLAYRTYGTLSAAGDNVIVLPTFYTGTNTRNEGFFGPDRAIDPARHFIISPNLFGNGRSSSPSNTPVPQDGPRFPLMQMWDNIAAQHRLIHDHLGIKKIALVAGWSMAGCQSYQWAAQYPDMVQAILPFCASAKTSPHNFVFLEGVKAALCADQNWNSGNYDCPPEAGLKAFGRVYAGWAFSQTFYREGLYEQLGFQSIEELMQDWEQDHVQGWDANNLLAKLATWQAGDISAGPLYNGDYKLALGAIKARAILMPCTQDLYFPPEDNEIEAHHMPSAIFRPYDSPWGHCAANPGYDKGFAAQLDVNIRELLEE